MEARPVIFLDFDDVVVLNRSGEFGGYEVISSNPPPELWAQFFHPPAIQTLVEAVEEHKPQIVITTSWLRFMQRDGFERLFKLTGFDQVSQSLHDAWDAPQNRGETRSAAIDRWLVKYHLSVPYVILDDELSGTGLAESIHAKRGRVILCKQDVGLHRGHLRLIRAALTTVPT